MSNRTKPIHSPIDARIITGSARKTYTKHSTSINAGLCREKLELLKDFCVIDRRNKQQCQEYLNHMLSLSSEISLENFVVECVKEKLYNERQKERKVI